MKLYFALSLLLIVLCACENPPTATPQATRFGGVTMGTAYAVKLAGAPENITVGALRGQVQKLLDDLDAKMSTYRADSELSRFNAYRGDDWFAVSEDTARVVAEALRVSEQTGGAFDVTVAPLLNLWGFGPKRRTGEIPSDAAIAEARTLVGYKFLHARPSPPALRKTKPALAVDLGGIAPGYAVDRVCAHLDALGIGDYLVDISGDIRARGNSHLGRPWRVAIESPLATERKIQRTVELRDLAMTTSGDYRNFFEKEGRRFSHVFDPRTGRPVAHALASVSVVAATAMEADAVATALLVLGSEEGFTFAERHNLAALFLVRTERGFAERTTRAFAPLVLNR